MEHEDPRNEIATDVDGFTDEMLAEARQGHANVMVSIGVLGLSIAILNPASAKAAIARCEEIRGRPATADDTIWVIGFDDALATYEIGAI